MTSLVKNCFAPIEFGTPDMDEALALRDLVLRKPLGMVFETQDIEEEYKELHYAAFDTLGHLIAVLSLKNINEEVYKMRQVAVSPYLQGKGIGQKLVAYVECVLKSKNIKRIELHARDTAISFYKKLGYKIEGEPFEEVSIKHSFMYKNL